MANFKSITTVPEVTEVPDGAKILLNVDGAAKQVTKENAKFGSGMTVYNIVGGDTTGYSLQNLDGTTPTAQDVYDASMAGSVCGVYEGDDGTYYLSSRFTPNIDTSGAVIGITVNIDGDITIGTMGAEPV